MNLPVFTKDNWTLDGLAFNAGPDGRGFSYIVKQHSGWTDSPEPRPDYNDRPSGDGSYRSANYSGARVVTLKGIGRCATRADRDALADSLAGLCRDRNTLYSLVRNEFSRSLSCLMERQSRTVIRETAACEVTFDIQLIGPDPRKYSTTVNEAFTGIAEAALEGVQWDGPALPATGTLWNGAAIPVTGLQWQASSGSSGALVLTNAGPESTPIYFTVTAPPAATLAMPTITDVTHGNVLTFNGTMAAADVLVLDTKNGNTLLNGVPAGGQLSRSDFFSIPAGETITVQFSAGGPANGAQLKAEWSDAY